MSCCVVFVFITAEKRIDWKARGGRGRACVGIHLGDDTGLKSDSSSGDGDGVETRGDKAVLASSTKTREESRMPPEFPAWMTEWG